MKINLITITKELYVTKKKQTRINYPRAKVIFHLSGCHYIQCSSRELCDKVHALGLQRKNIGEGGMGGDCVVFLADRFRHLQSHSPTRRVNGLQHVARRLGT